jgi:hypothetical protein
MLRSMSTKGNLSISYIRARRPGGSQCIVSLMDLEDALSGGPPGAAYLLPDSGKIILKIDGDYTDEEQEDVPDNAVKVERISSHKSYEWTAATVLSLTSS